MNTNFGHYSEEHKVAIFTPPKTMSTSLRFAYDASYIEDRNTKDFSSYWKLGVLRSPVLRVISGFHESKIRAWGDSPGNKERDYVHIKDPLESFKNFVDDLVINGPVDDHLMPQSSFLLKDLGDYDKLFIFESHLTWIPYLEKKHGVKILHHNKKIKDITIPLFLRSEGKRELNILMDYYKKDIDIYNSLINE